MELFGEDASIQAAPEPSNVIWENLEVTPLLRGSLKFGVIVLISIFIFITFLVYTALKSQAGNNKLTYPSSTNCAGIQDLFVKENGNPDTTDWKAFKEYADHDKDETLSRRGAGYYMCYCKTKYKNSFKFFEEPNF